MEPPPLQPRLDCGGRQLRWLLAAGSGALMLVSAVVPLTLIGQFHTCLFLRFTGYPCLFCGLTRAFLLLAHGHIAAAWRIAPIGIPLFLAVLAVFLWSAAGLATGQRLNIRLPWRWLLPVGVVLLLANWIYRLAAGLK